ncbi:hypothetical protein SDC9_139319 [bioreactor metagenome]|uniref:Uncharacterized protein n=1 Tax=bioreactor metagenome TaxID=1076179 RepID=A0A645DRT1_9ZZZZ
MNRTIVQQDRARAALPLGAAFFHAGQAQIIPQNIQQTAVGRSFERDRLFVDKKVKRHSSLSPLSSAMYFKMESGSKGSVPKEPPSASFTAPHTAGATGT